MATTRMEDKTAAIKLHLGCGKRYIPGFVHVDLANYPHIDYNHAIDRLPMFSDASVSLIYACHAFEYFDREQAPGVLAEWRRILNPGGILRLAVPDFEALVKVYETSGDLGRVLGPLFGRWVVPSSEAEIVIYHRTVYDFRSLSELMVDSGFTDIRRYDWRATIHKDYDDYSQAYYPHMDKEHGRLISLNVEGVKA